jgi:Protein of unknown function (DUF2490)
MLVALLLLDGGGRAARADDKDDEYRFTVSPSYAITADKRWIGVGYFGYYDGPDRNYDVGYAGLGAMRRISEWADVWMVAQNLRTDNEGAPDVNEYRPAIGFKNYFTRSGPFTFYNFARMEYRIVERDSPGADSEYFRFRDQVGVEFALGETANKPGGWYALTDVEAFYRFDVSEWDLMQLRAGVGVTINEYVRLELIYYMQFARAGNDDSFDWTGNIYRLNVKVARHKGLLDRLAHSHTDE